MDRVAIVDYVSVEDPPEEGVHAKGEIRDYDQLFREIISAVKAGRVTFKIDERPYALRFFSDNLAPMAGAGLG